MVSKMVMGAFLYLRIMKTCYQHLALVTWRAVILTVTKINVVPFSPNLMVSVLCHKPQKGMMDGGGGGGKACSFIILLMT